MYVETIVMNPECLKSKTFNWRQFLKLTNYGVRNTRFNINCRQVNCDVVLRKSESYHIYTCNIKNKTNKREYKNALNNYKYNFSENK